MNPLKLLCLLLVVFALVLTIPPAVHAKEKRGGSHTMTNAAMSARAVPNESLEKADWTLPKPPYPAQAFQKHEEGIVYVEVTTDATGKIIRAAIPTDTKVLMLAQNSVDYALHVWHGPANATATMKIEYRLR